MNPVGARVVVARRVLPRPAGAGARPVVAAVGAGARQVGAAEIALLRTLTQEVKNERLLEAAKNGETEAVSALVQAGADRGYK